MHTRSILITGCSSGIGYCVAHGLHKRGWRVFATARKPADVERLVAEGLESLPLDLDDSDSIESAVTEILARTGNRLDAVFHNGAYSQPGAVEDLGRDVLRKQFETNLFGWHELNNRVLPVMRAQGHGRIIYNSSVLGFVAMRFRGAYNASKFALEGLVDTLRLELRGTDIHAVLIEPGPITSRIRENAWAAYQTNIDPVNSAHHEDYRKLEKRLTTEGAVTPFTLGPAAVLKRVIQALESRRPRDRYRVTFPTHLFAWLKCLLPGRLLDRILSGH